MGKLIVKKVTGLSWKAKVSLVLIFVLAFSVFMCNTTEYLLAFQ